MGDLEVATDELRSLATRISRLVTRLDNTDADVDYQLDEVGHRHVIDGLDEFRKNWDDNRAHLADKLTKLGELAEETADGFDQADEELAKEIIKATEGVGS